LPKHASNDAFAFGAVSLPSDNIGKVIRHHYEKEHNNKLS